MILDKELTMGLITLGALTLYNFLDDKPVSRMQQRRTEMGAPAFLTRGDRCNNATQRYGFGIPTGVDSMMLNGPNGAVAARQFQNDSIKGKGSSQGVVLEPPSVKNAAMFTTVKKPVGIFYPDAGGYIGVRRNQQYYGERAITGWTCVDPPREIGPASVDPSIQPDPYAYRAKQCGGTPSQLPLNLRAIR